ncbi:Tripartite motif-containing protein 3-like [Oopsacas minuta]|uniref:Tripartite motif-containing protein 3-like n=1 Tax=Oopsacas minuta TaxID=111878 RepID=A0AAV7KFC3_9METZ|nr:Tripartite motif-containing protein 3-like [Oopsacas minuta]
MNCVEVFDSAAKYLFRFGDSKGEGKMTLSIGLAICGNRILISQTENCILNYELDGDFISKIGKYGTGKLEFRYPFGLSISESNEDIYICDFSNNKVQILSKDFHFKYQFGRDLLNHPRDVKLIKDYSYIIDVDRYNLVFISLIKISFYRRLLYLEEKECK